MFYEADTNNNGTVDYTEFLSIFVKYFLKENIQEDQDELLMAFNIFDLNNDGMISGEELLQLKAMLMDTGVEKLSEDLVDEMIYEADINADGKISLAEFTHLMQNN